MAMRCFLLKKKCNGNNTTALLINPAIVTTKEARPDEIVNQSGKLFKTSPKRNSASTSAYAKMKTPYLSDWRQRL